ncbi:MAG: hypothetical protein P8Y23_04005, partial [Candidatus Lokiarchaeota archaeon]
MVSKIGKGTSIVAIIALLLALGASGFIIYDQFTAVPEIQPSSKQYYIYDSSSHYVPGSEVWSIINTMKIDFTINLGQKVYFSYSGMA